MWLTWLSVLTSTVFFASPWTDTGDISSALIEADLNSKEHKNLNCQSMIVKIV